MLQIIDHERLTARLTAAAEAVALPRRRAEHFHASELTCCLRRTGYELLGVEPSDPTYNPNYELAAAQGELIHEHLQAHLRHAGLVYELPSGPAIEVALDESLAPELDRYHLSGRVDAVLRLNSGELSILDIKTVGGRWFQSGGRWVEEKLARYAAQVMVYMHFFRLPDGAQITRGFVYVVSRDDTTQRALYRVAYDPQLIQPILLRLAAAADAVRGGELPAPEPALGPCRFCGYRSRCPGFSRDRASTGEGYPPSDFRQESG